LDFIWYWSIAFIHIKSICEQTCISHRSYRKCNYTHRPSWKEEIKTGNPLDWSYDWPKEWPLSVQSSSTTTLLDRSSTREQGYNQATLEDGVCPRLWIDTHLLEMKIETNYGFKRWPSAESKDDPVPSQNQGVSGWTEEPRLPTKVSFKGGSHLGNPNLSFFLASPNLGDEISIKGGTL
jgi:hypothetical protein